MSVSDKNELPIGVFDSGMGGLTVLKALKEALPQESYIYLGDTARLPYGTKGRLTVVHYARQMAALLHERGIKMLIIACNTATIAALSDLQSLFSDIPVIGVIQLGAKASINQSRNRKILVLATEATVRSESYPKHIHHLSPQSIVTSKACGLFVALAEEGIIEGPIVDEAIKAYLKDAYSDEDCVLLGCTHFPVLKKALQAYLGQQVVLVDPAIEIAKAVRTLLQEQKLQARTTLPSTQYLATDLPERFSRVGEIFLKEPIALKAIELVTV